MPACEICAALPEEIPGKTMVEIAELSSRVEEIETDYKKWTAIFRCKTRGQIWEERFTSHGHSNVPSVYKVKW